MEVIDMNEFDEKIKKVMKKEIQKPFSYEYAIKNAFYRKEKNKHKNLFLKIATTMVCFMMGCTVVMASSYIIYEKIWKEPIKFSQEEEQEYWKEQEKIIKENIVDEEKLSFITEEEAIEQANVILNKLDYENQSFKSIELIRDYNKNIHYVLSTGSEVGQGILIHLNPINGELEYFCDNEVGKESIKCDEIAEDEIKEIANRTYAELGIIHENDNNYQIVEVQRQFEAINGVMHDMWQVSYGKTYDGLIDRDSMFSTCFSVINGKKIFYIIKGKTDSTFNSNEIVLSEESAKEIAIKKEEQFSNLDISEVNAKLSIEKMNSFIYYLENNSEYTDELYKVNDISRIVWVVEVKHDKKERITKTDLKTIKELYNKKYYIDASTGEIIGGEQAELFQ